MSRRLEVVVGVVIAAGVALALGAVALLWAGLPRYDVPTVVLPVDDTAASRARGQALARVLCMRCHFDPATGALSGRPYPEVPSSMGRIASANLTQDPEVGLGGWTPGDLAYLLRSGVDPTSGTLVPPWMPRWPHVADRDLADLAVFLLQAEHPWVAAHAESPERSRYSPYVTWLARTQWDPLPYPMQPVPHPGAGDPVAHGRYLVESLYRCGACHHGGSADPTQLDLGITPGDLSGGLRMKDAAGEAVIAANLTPAGGAAVGSIDALRSALVDGFREDGSLVRWPMPRYPELSELELEAIFAYLRTLAPVERATPPVTRRVIGPKADPGRHVYERAGCPSCHDHDGQGIASLAELPDDDAAVVRFIEHPSGDTAALMPAWAGRIAPSEYPALVAHLRSLAGPKP